MKTNLDWKVSEDNGGGLQLWVLENNNVVFASSGYEFVPGQLSMDLESLRKFDSINDWEGNDVEAESYNAQEEYEKMLESEYWPIIAEGQDDYMKIYHGMMGAAGRKEFDPDGIYKDDGRFEIRMVIYKENK